MQVNVKQRVRNTRLGSSNSLFPLFEAVVNSIQAIEEAGDHAGRIDIQIQRDTAQSVLAPEDVVSEPIHSFIVQDNGIGFTDQNYKSFDLSDSDRKADQGGKGIGRFLWLKAFQQANIQSSYTEDGRHWLRKFRFTLSDDGVEGHTKQEAALGPRRTTVTLETYRDPYREKCPRSAKVIAKRIIDHYLEYFVLGRAPKIILHDMNDLEILDLNLMFAQEIQPHTSTQAFKLGEREFSVTHLRVPPAYESQHRIYFCAHRRAVFSESLVNKIPNLAQVLHDHTDQRPFVYIGYVSGAYLNDTVTPERTSFYAHENNQLNLGEDVVWTDLTSAAIQQATQFLAPFTDPVREEKEQQIRRYVQDRAPQYRPLLKHRSDALNVVPPNLPEEKLDLELYKLNQSYETELKERYQSLLKPPDTAAEPDVYERQLEEFMQEWNELGMAKLAKHVVHRKATLSFLEASLGVGEDGKYKLENAIHRIVFPLKKTSDDVKPDQMNLWMLDEKLAYHYYLASDIPFSEMKDVVEVNSADRPDLLIFHGSVAFADSAPPFSSLTLIEFKRPARNAYDDDDNPISQVYDYVREIKAGKAKDRKDRPITVPDHTPIYVYIICYITPKLRKHAENHPLTATPDLDGYYGYNPNLKVYVEIVSFSNLLAMLRKGMPSYSNSWGWFNNLSNTLQR